MPSSLSLKGLVTEEFTHEPVPKGKRKHWMEVAAVWMGFTMAASLAVLGGIVQGGVGVGRGLVAIFAGNCLLFVYSTLLGLISFETGLNFPLVAKRAFGTRGYVFASFILSGLVLGWFAVQSDMFGVLLQTTVLASVPRWMLTLVFALLFMTTAALGYRAMVFLSFLVVPSFILLGGWASWRAFVDRGLSISFDAPADSSMGMGAAISIVAASFIVSATMTGDFVRWARSRREVVLVHFLAFVVGLSATMIFGLLLSAAGQQTDLFTTLVVLGLAGPGAVMTGLNLWSTCDNCLYNSALGFTNQISTLRGRRTSQKFVVITLGLLGSVLAMLGAYSNYDTWLLILGTVVPPAGGIIIADYYVAYKSVRSRYEHTFSGLPAFRPHSILAWVLGVIVAFAIERLYPSVPAAYVGAFVGGITYVLGSRKGSSDQEQALLSTQAENRTPLLERS